MVNEKLYSTFFLDKFFYGIEVHNVQEVITHQAMSSVPLAPSVIIGLINLRGQIVIAIDLRRRLNLPDRDREQFEKSNIMVIRTSVGVVSLVVDDIGGVLEVDDSIFERPPETLSGVAKELIIGSYKLKNRLLHILDVEKIVDIGVDMGEEKQMAVGK